MDWFLIYALNTVKVFAFNFFNIPIPAFLPFIGPIVLMMSGFYTHWAVMLTYFSFDAYQRLHSWLKHSDYGCGACWKSLWYSHMCLSGISLSNSGACISFSYSAWWVYTHFFGAYMSVYGVVRNTRGTSDHRQQSFQAQIAEFSWLGLSHWEI